MTCLRDLQLQFSMQQQVPLIGINGLPYNEMEATLKRVFLAKELM